MRNTRNISWIKAARKDFEDFPEDVQSDVLDALTVAAEGGKSDKAKPFKSVDGGVFEIALKHRGDAFRAIYALKMTRIFGWFTHSRKNRSQGSRPRKWRLTLFESEFKRLKEALK